MVGGIIIFILCGFFVSLGATLYVSPTGSGTACTQSDPCSFQTALTKAETSTEDDTVLVAPGTYSVKSSLSYITDDFDKDGEDTACTKPN